MLFIVESRELEVDPLLLVSEVRLQATQRKVTVPEVPTRNPSDDLWAFGSPSHPTPKIDEALEGCFHLEDPGQSGEIQTLRV